MASRSTRDKIRWASKKGRQNLIDCQEHYIRLGMLASEQSPYINEHLPGIIAALEGMIGVLNTFDEGL